MGARIRDRFATYRAISGDLPTDGVFVFDPDLRHLVADGGSSGAPGSRIQGLTVSEAFPAHIAAVLEPPYRAALAGERLTFELHHDGRTFSVVVGPVCDGDDTGIVAGTAYWRDVSEERRATTALRHAEERFRAVFEHAPIGMAIIGLDGRYHEINQALCDITGYSADELRQRTYRDLTHPDDVDAHRADVRRLVKGDVTTLQVEQRYLGPDGQPVWVLVSASVVNDDTGRPLYIISHVVDIDERKRREQQLQWQAERDNLTGLWNRHRFEQELARRTSLRERHGDVTSVILLDLDDFKSVNDTHGHGAGDEVLRRVARVLRANVRTPDIASRYGGDEFAVVLPQTTRDEATRLAERLLWMLSARPIVLGGHTLVVSASAGVADNASGLDPVAAADRALYAAKRARTER